MESRDEFIKVKFYDAWNISEPITNLDCNSRISICDIKKIEMSSQSKQRKSQNIESDLVSIFIYLL